MFTGLVEAMGSIERVEPRPLGRRLRIQTTIVEGEARPGDSIAVNGCCLTAVATDRAGFEVETVAETLARTTLGSLAAGDLVNLEVDLVARYLARLIEDAGLTPRTS